MKYCYWPSRC